MTNLDDGLTYAAIKATFSTLPIHKKRKLVLELLKDAGIVHGMEIYPVEPVFVKWLCSGRKKLFTTKETDHLWTIWSFIRKYAMSGDFSDSDNDYAGGYRVYPHLEDFKEDDEVFRIEIFRRKDGLDSSDTRYYYSEVYSKISWHTLNREAFFDHILANTLPDKFIIRGEDQDWTPNFITDSHILTIESLMDNGYGE